MLQTLGEVDSSKIYTTAERIIMDLLYLLTKNYCGKLRAVVEGI